MGKKNTEKDSDCLNDNNNNQLAPLNWTIQDIYWKNFLILLGVHLHLPYALYLIFYCCHGYTTLFTYLFALAGGIAVTAGNHRLWSHRSYKAKLPFQILLMLFSTTVFQEDIIFWCRVHRVHHKYTDTDGDPHNSKRGFFYSHWGWLCLKEPKAVTEKCNQIDLTDLTSDHLLQFQRRYFWILTVICFILVPTITPTLWGESVWNSFNLLVIFKFFVQINAASSVNSFAHLYGTQPYDKRMGARQNLVANFLSFGEGFHNYHHTFPHDYRTSEFGALRQYNLTKLFIDFFAWIGLAYDLKTVPSDVITKRKIKTGGDI